MVSVGYGTNDPAHKVSYAQAHTYWYHWFMATERGAKPDGDLDHPARVYLIDADGRIREIYSLAFFGPRQALIDILALTK